MEQSVCNICQFLLIFLEKSLLLENIDLYLLWYLLQASLYQRNLNPIILPTTQAPLQFLGKIVSFLKKQLREYPAWLILKIIAQL